MPQPKRIARTMGWLGCFTTVVLLVGESASFRSRVFWRSKSSQAHIGLICGALEIFIPVNPDGPESHSISYPYPPGVSMMPLDASWLTVRHYALLPVPDFNWKR